MIPQNNFAKCQQVVAEGRLRRLFFSMRIFLLILFMLSVIWVWNKIHDPTVFPIKKVQINATYSHIDPQNLRQLIDRSIEGNYFGLNVHKLQHDILRLPWVFSVALQRSWPDKVIITIVEQKAVAKWNNNSLLNDEALIFTPKYSTLPDDFPLLYGDNSQASAVLQMYNKLRQIFSGRGIYISKLALSANNAWSLTLSNGVNVYLGGIQPLVRAKRFSRVYYKIVSGNSDKVASVDLRYSNGLAIRRK